MKVGVCEAQQLKERGEKLGLTLADTLLGYMIRIHILSFWREMVAIVVFL